MRVVVSTIRLIVRLKNSTRLTFLKFIQRLTKGISCLLLQIAMLPS